MTDEADIARDLREALRPIWRRLASANTISVGKMGILAYLKEHGRATAAALAVAEHVSAQAVATSVRELEEAGYVVRTRDDVDRRRVWIDVTPAGKERLERERALGQEWLVDAMTTTLDAGERNLVAAAVPALRKLGQHASAG